MPAWTDGSNYISISMDDQIISSPYVSSEYASTGINSEHVSITLGSNATQEYASQLAGLIASGQLPFSLTNIQLDSVSATLGLQALNTSIQAAIIGLILIILFMVFYYRVLGLASAVSLIFFAVVFVNIISFSHLNLTLAGIAGIILTLGMAVDANVIIFERIKEELQAGRTVRVAMDAGFKNAFSAILDSNITTCIAACCLWWQGNRYHCRICQDAVDWCYSVDVYHDCDYTRDSQNLLQSAQSQKFGSLWRGRRC